MSQEWPRERLEKLTTKELEVLERNARDRGRHDVADDAFSVRLGHMTETEKKKALGVFNFERKIASYLGEVALKLSKEFDLSTETAAKRGTATPHELTDSRGDAKTGGVMKSGEFTLYRYISYKLGETRLKAAVILHKNITVDKALYALVGSTDVVTNGEIKPDLELVAGEVAVILPSIEALAEEYGKLLATFAPRR